MTATDGSLTEPGLMERARWAVADSFAVAGRDVSHWRRQPAAVLVNALFQVLLLLMFVYLLGGGMVVPGGGDYRDFLVPGMLALAMVFGVEATMTAVVTDTARGITDRFRSLPLAPSAVVAGPAAPPDPGGTGERVVVPVPRRRGVVGDVVRVLDDAGIAVDDVVLRPTTLDEAYLRITGADRAATEVPA